MARCGIWMNRHRRRCPSVVDRNEAWHANSKRPGLGPWPGTDIVDCANAPEVTLPRCKSASNLRRRCHVREVEQRRGEETVLVELELIACGVGCLGPLQPWARQLIDGIVQWGDQGKGRW